MDRNEIHQLVKDISGANALMVDQDRWVSIKCPLAPIRHAKGTDSHPSAGISVKPNGTSIFNCLTCRAKGTVPWLLRAVGKMRGEDYSRDADAIERGEFYGGSIPEWGEQIEPEQQLVPLDKHLYLDLYDSAEGHPYLRERRISDAAARKAQLLVDPCDSVGAERILFPVFGRDGNLYGFTGRRTDGSKELRVRDYHGLQKAKLVLGAHLITKSDKYVAVVEGPVDYAVMLSHGIPTVATLGTNITDAQAAILVDFGKPLVYFHDVDEGGQGEQARELLKEKVWRHVPLLKVVYPQESTVETQEGGLRPPRDPAELTRAQAMRMLQTKRFA